MPFLQICISHLLLLLQLPVRALAFSPDGRYALSASQGEPQIPVWHLEGPASKKSQPSCGLLSLEDPAVQIASSPAPSSAPADTFQVGGPPCFGACPYFGASLCHDISMLCTRQYRARVYRLRQLIFGSM